MSEQAKYTVKTSIECGFSFINLQYELAAPNADEAIRRGHRYWTAEGYSGPFRYTSAENIEDAHDYKRSTV